jgi:tRNA 5-methylaminomethyl-2-thiouridine biosynthesis bifunctional protein
MRVAILGGGLAGCAAAYVLKQAGHEPVIYEAGEQLATGASGNQIGLYNPRFGAEWTAHSQYYAQAFGRALEVFSELDDIDFSPCGALHLITDEKKERRFSKMVDAWKVSGDCDVEMQILSAAEASKIAGVEIEKDVLYLPQSGSVSPAKLCAAYASGIEVHTNVRVEDPSSVDADAVILANGPALKKHIDTKHVDLQTVRGQVTLIQPSEESKNLQCHICYGGYVSKVIDGVHVVGSTFQRWLDHSELLEQDDTDNLEKLCAAVPSLQGAYKIIGQRASVRVTTKDYFPVVGHLKDNFYISTGHGSHGILSSLIAADVLSNMIDDKPQSLSADVIQALSPQRFVD